MPRCIPTVHLVTVLCLRGMCGRASSWAGSRHPGRHSDWQLEEVAVNPVMAGMPVFGVALIQVCAVGSTSHFKFRHIEIVDSESRSRSPGESDVRVNQPVRIRRGRRLQVPISNLQEIRATVTVTGALGNYNLFWEVGLFIRNDKSPILARSGKLQTRRLQVSGSAGSHAGARACEVLGRAPAGQRAAPQA
jgi:hypothetical protein